MTVHEIMIHKVQFNKELMQYHLVRVLATSAALAEPKWTFEALEELVD